MAEPTGRFEFDADPHLGVILCPHVRDGAPILYVCRDEDGAWQFLCGADHGEDEPPALVGLSHVVEQDPTVNEVASLCSNHRAEREAVGAPWEITDEGEEFIHEAIAEHGWAVEMIPAGDSPEEPEFAYTIGLHRSFGHPELLLVGLPPEVSHEILNLCGDRVSAGESFVDGARVGEVLEGMDVQFREVCARASFEEYVGYALWYYGDESFRLMQLMWPDAEGRFPGEPGAEGDFARRQPCPE